MRIKLILLASFLIGALNGSGYSQYMASSKLSGIGVPFFQAGIYRTFKTGTEDSLRLIKIYFQIINDDLTFLKQENNYIADVEFDIYVTGKNKDFTFNRTIDKKIVTPSFEETNSRQATNTFNTDIELKPGQYDLVITALDKNNNKQVNRKIEFNLDNIDEKSFLLSDILFFQEYKTDSTGRIEWFNPNLTNNFGGSKKFFYFYFSSAVENPGDTLRIEYIIRNPEGIVTQYNQYIVANAQNINDHYIRINRQQFDQARYELEVIGHYHNSEIKNKKLFSFYWTESPDSPQDLSNALRQMRYIVEADSVGWALKQTYEEKQGYFKRFWKRMDPNPDTEKNELLDEYYQRVNIANQNFSTLSLDGWETDMGRIYIKFGEPDDIERHPFELDSPPYEIWRYYDLRKIFLFVDRTGFGDYYLDPGYLDQEFN
jgi:GWxTD domain-containing protein